jgi:hypothetical protein
MREEGPASETLGFLIKKEKKENAQYMCQFVHIYFLLLFYYFLLRLFSFYAHGCAIPSYFARVVHWILSEQKSYSAKKEFTLCLL